MLRECAFFEKTEQHLMNLGFEREQEGYPFNYYRHKRSALYTISLYRDNCDIILTLEESTGYFIEIAAFNRRQLSAFKKFWPILERTQK